MDKQVAAIIAAAGRSRRMGQPKQLLPWGAQTVIGRVVQNLASAGADPVVCVVGHLEKEVRSALEGTTAQVIANPHYLAGEMLSSYQQGVRRLQARCNTFEQSPHVATDLIGTLLVLGDQPHIPVDIIRQVIVEARAKPRNIVIPSYQMRRGHPIFLPHHLWNPLLTLGPDETLRHLMRQYNDEVIYVNVETDLVLRDMDTPEAYHALWKSQVEK